MPTGGSFASGNGTMTVGGSGMDIHQTTTSGIIDWQSFSIGAGNHVFFDNGSGTTLNRVTGNAMSLIDGSLSATGSLYLVNPAGVVVGSDGTITTGGAFIASTHDLSDEDFLNGGSAEFSGLSNAEIVNNGTISSANGDVALIARKVTNTGTISAPNGTAALAAGYDVLMSDTSGVDGKFAVKVGGSDTGVVNSGTVKAAEIEMRANGGSVYALAGNTDSVVKATGVSSSGGRIFLTAGGSGTVESTAHVVARKSVPFPTERPAEFYGGDISITAGTIDLAGTVDASGEGTGTSGGTIIAIAKETGSYAGELLAKGGTGGTGGLIETSGTGVAIADDIFVSTLAEGGTAGTWLIDPYNVTISNDTATGSGYTATANDTVINATTLSNALASTGVTVSTGAGGGQNGDITVAAPITWSANTTLTLNAAGDININGPIAASGASAGLALTFGGDYSIGGGTVTLSGASASLDIGSTAYTLIHDVNDLQAINGAGNYALAQTIDATGTKSWNSGDGFNPINGFSGMLAGLGNAIDGLTVDRGSEGSVGMFVTTSGGFRDFTLSNVSIVSGGSAGGLAYRLNSGSSVNNVHVTGSVTSLGGGGQVGGLIGWTDQAPISNSSSAATVTGIGEVGGLVGRLRSATISNSYATGAVTGTSDYVGGLVGSAQSGGTLTNVYASGNVTGTTNVGGLVGGTLTADAVNATNAYWDMDSTGQSTSFAGTGIANANAYTQSTYSGFDFANTWVIIPGKSRPMLQSEYSTTIATAHQLQLMSQNVGADYTLVGDIDMTGAFTANSGGYYGDVWGSSGFNPIGTGVDPFTGSLDGLDHKIAGLVVNGGSGTYKGLFGSVDGATLSNLSLVDASVTGGAYVAALAGYARGDTTVTNVHAGGSVTASGGYAGMLVGAMLYTSITYSSSSGSVTALGTSGNTGGLVGQMATTGSLDNVYSTANVRGHYYLGGLVGFSRGSISNAYAMGSVTGVADGGQSASNIAALVGFQLGGLVTSSFATGYVSDAWNRGGLVGGMAGTVVTNSYWDKETTGTQTDVDGTPATTADLQGTLPAGFSSTIWGIGEGLYPYLKWQFSGTPVAVSGKAYSDNGTTALAGANVSAISGGALLGSAGTGANGYYYILAAPGALDAAGALAYLDGEGTKAGAFSDTVAATGITNLDIYGSSLNLIAGGSTLGGTLANLNTALGSYSDTDLNFFNPLSTKVTFDDYGLYLRADQAYAIDGSLSSGGALSLSGSGTYSVSGNRVLSARGALSIGSAFQWSDASALTLTTTTGGNIQLDAGITASSGSLTIDGSGSIATGANGTVDVALFDLTAGAWSQVGASLPSFSADDFRIDPVNAAFLRALGGNGATGTPYRIADIYGMQGIGSASLLAKDFVLANDLDASGTAGWHSGAGFDPIGTYAGVFNGQGHTISDLTIHRGAENSVGLFSTLSGTVSDIGLVGGDIEAGGDSGTLVGAVNSSGVLTRSYSSASISSSDNFTGGLVGHNYGTISLSFASGAVTSTASSAGGLVGANDGTITDSYATGAVSAATFAGGFAGGNRATLEHVYSTGLVSSAGAKGGLTPYNVGTITDGYWNTETSGTSDGLGTGLTTAQLQSLSIFAGAGWDIDDAGGTGAVWRIYDGYTAPLLRNFMTGLTVTGDSRTKTYDGIATSTDVGTLSYSPSGHDSSLVLGTATYTTSSADAGSYSGSDVTLGGLYSTQFGYDMTLVAGTVTVNKAALTVTANNDSKTYDGNAYSGGNGVSYSGFVHGETSSVLAGTLVYDGSSQGAVNAGTYTITASGFTSGNYDISYVGGTLTIGAATLNLTITPDAASKTYGQTLNLTDFSTSGLVGSDSISSVTLTSAGTAATANVGSYDISSSNAVFGSGSASNYDIHYNTLTGGLTVNKAALTVTANNDSKTYDGNAYSGGNGVSYSGFVNSETSSVLSGALSYGGSSQGAVNAGSYAITVAGLTSGNYDISYFGGTLTVTAAQSDTTQAGTFTTDGLPNPYANAQSRAIPTTLPTLSYSYSRVINLLALGDPNLTTASIGEDGGATDALPTGTMPGLAPSFNVNSRLVFAPGTFDILRDVAESDQQGGDAAAIIGAALSSNPTICTAGVAGPMQAGVPYPCNVPGQGS